MSINYTEFKKMSLTEKEDYLKKILPGKIRYAGIKSSQVKKVRDIAKNRAPNTQMHIAAEGIWLNLLAIQSNVKSLFVLANLDSIHTPEAAELLYTLTERSHSCYLISKKTLETIAESGSHAGIISILALPTYNLEDLPNEKNSLIVILDGLEIPGNIGTIARSADATGADAVIITNKKTRLTHPKYIRSSQGSCFNLPVLEEDLGHVIKYLRSEGYSIVLADTDGSIPFYEKSYTCKTAIVMGSEKYGISPQWYNEPHSAVNIPMFGDCDSLNVSIAATILLYEASLKKRKLR